MRYWLAGGGRGGRTSSFENCMCDGSEVPSICFLLVPYNLSPKNVGLICMAAYNLLSVPETSIAPKLSTNPASDSSEVVPVPENAANAVLKFADNSLKLTVEAGILYSPPEKKTSVFSSETDLFQSSCWPHRIDVDRLVHF